MNNSIQSTNEPHPYLQTQQESLAGHRDVEQQTTTDRSYSMLLFSAGGCGAVSRANQHIAAEWSARSIIHVRYYGDGAGSGSQRDVFGVDSQLHDRRLHVHPLQLRHHGIVRHWQYRDHAQSNTKQLQSDI